MERACRWYASFLLSCQSFLTLVCTAHYTIEYPWYTPFSYIMRIAPNTLNLLRYWFAAIVRFSLNTVLLTVKKLTHQLQETETFTKRPNTLIYFAIDSQLSFISPSTLLTFSWLSKVNLVYLTAETFTKRLYKYGSSIHHPFSTINNYIKLKMNAVYYEWYNKLIGIESNTSVG